MLIIPEIFVTETFSFTHMYTCILYISPQVIWLISQKIKISQPYLFSGHIYINSFCNIYDSSFKFYTCIHVCTEHMHTYDLVNISSVLYLSPIFVLFL